MQRWSEVCTAQHRLIPHSRHRECRAEMHNSGLNPVPSKRAVVHLPARIRAEDDKRAFGALLGPDGDERARGHTFTAPASISIDTVAFRAKGVILAKSGRMSSSPPTVRGFLYPSVNCGQREATARSPERAESRSSNGPFLGGTG